VVVIEPAETAGVSAGLVATARLCHAVGRTSAWRSVRPPCQAARKPGCVCATFHIQYRRTGTIDWTSDSVASSDSAYYLGWLTAGASYDVRISSSVAENERGSPTTGTQGAAPDGTPVSMAATSADVMRRRPDNT
jgi:hypothetical protein